MWYKKFKNVISDFYEQEKFRIPNFIPVGIGIGICSYFALDAEPSFIANVITFIILLCATIYYKAYRHILCIFLTISLGFISAQLRTKYVNTYVWNEGHNLHASFTATVETCEQTEKGLTFIVKDITCEPTHQIPNIEKINKLHLTWRGDKAKTCLQDYQPGDKIFLCAILDTLKTKQFKKEYNFKQQQYFKGISARGFITREPKIIEPYTETGCDTYIERIRHTINKNIEQKLKGDTAAVTEALTTGNKYGISQDVRNSFARSGTAHILAISGLHMGIIGMFIFWLCRILLCATVGKYCNAKKISAVVSWIAVLCYLFISGCSVPSVRAFIMHTLIIIAILINRTALTMRSIAIAATLIMLYSPEVILFPSFQMSFGAVIAIVAFYEHAWDFSPYMKMLCNVLATTVIASIPTSLFSIYAFNQFTLNSILANLISVPLMSFCIMPLAVSMLFFMIFDWHGALISILGFVVDILIKISEYTSQLPGSFFVMHTPSTTTMIILVMSGLLFTLIHHRIRFAGIAGICIGIILYALEPLPDIFISPYAKAVGIRTPEAVCFNHLGHFRSLTALWTKSVGFEKAEKYTSPLCKKYLSKSSDGSYFTQIANTPIVISPHDNHPEDKNTITIQLHNQSPYAKEIYVEKHETTSTEKIKRPWS